MFYYVIYNSTVLNYSENNKNLNTFIYGTVLYILLHGLINSYNNQFALYIKSYFWVILAIDIFSIYYMYNYLNAELDNDKNSLKALIDSFYKKDSDNNNNTKKNNDKNENTKNQKKQSHITKNKQQNNIDQEDENENENEDENNELEQDPIPASNNEQYLYQNINDNDNNDNNDSNNTDDQMSDAGSDIDLDKFEMTL
jgi:hypothetical protein